MDTYEGPYANPFVQAFLVDTGQDIIDWTSRNPVMANDDWRVDAYTNGGESHGECFILAVSTPAGMVGFFAAGNADADSIRASLS